MRPGSRPATARMIGLGPSRRTCRLLSSASVPGQLDRRQKRVTLRDQDRHRTRFNGHRSVGLAGRLHSRIQSLRTVNLCGGSQLSIVASARADRWLFARGRLRKLATPGDRPQLSLGEAAAESERTAGEARDGAALAGRVDVRGYHPSQPGSVGQGGPGSVRVVVVGDQVPGWWTVPGASMTRGPPGPERGHAGHTTGNSGWCTARILDSG